MSELIRRLDPSRFLVHVVCFRRQGAWLPLVEAAAHEVVEFPLRSFKSPQTLAAMRAFTMWLRNRRIQVVHAGDRYANIFALPAAALVGVPGRIGSRRELAPPDQTRAHRTAMGLAYRTAHLVVANSSAAAAILRDEGVPASRIAVIPNGIEVATFPQRHHRDGHRTVTMVANLRPGKGHEVLLRAMSIVVRHVPDARLQLVGDGPLREPLERFARQLRVHYCVDFLGHCDDVPAVLASSDVSAFPSWSEAFPNGLLEAMAAGLPVVATATGGMVELVDHGRSGLLVQPGDARALAAAIVDLMEQPALADALGRAARAVVETRYSFDRMVGAFSQTYESPGEMGAPRCVA